MPLFEYRCEDCRRRVTLLVGMVARQDPLACPACGGDRLRKLVSRFAVARSEEDLLDSVADPSSLGDPEDPRAMAGWMRRVSAEMGEELGDDFEQLVEEAVREEESGARETEGAAPASAEPVPGSAEVEP